MSVALAGQFSSKFSVRHHDTKVMMWGCHLPEPTLEVADKGAGMTPAIV